MGELPLQNATMITQFQAEAPKVGQPATKAQARKVAEDFEAFFLSQFIENMFAGVKTDSQFGGGQGEDIFRSVLTQEYGKVMARNGGIGIADSVYREIIKLQEID